MLNTYLHEFLQCTTTWVFTVYIKKQIFDKKRDYISQTTQKNSFDKERDYISQTSQKNSFDKKLDYI